MLGNRGRDTQPELALRSEVHARGLRFRVNSRPLPSFRVTADLVFRRARVAVFVDGCFWHGCPQHFRPPKTNAEYWGRRIEANVRRRPEIEQALARAGWTAVRIWEHEDVTEAASRVVEAVRSRPRLVQFDGSD